MATVCPTITAYNQEDYQNQMEKVAGFAHRIQIDLTDGQFTKEATVGPSETWWQVGHLVDLHLMYKNPVSAIKVLAEHKPNLMIVHAESEGDFNQVINLCKPNDIKVGIALLQGTSTQPIVSVIKDLDHVLIFSGNLGYQGGSHADFSLLDKVKSLKDIRSDIEIGWDGGVNDQNIAELILAGVDVINAGGFIQNAEDPATAYKVLQRIADETGTT